MGAFVVTKIKKKVKKKLHFLILLHKNAYLCTHE